MTDLGVLLSGLSQHDLERAIRGLGAFATSGSQSSIRFMEECFEKSGLETLECRRLKRTEKFALKAAADENFSKRWFPTGENEHEINMRHKKKYIEFGAKTNRLYNSPLHYMRRLLNEEAAL